MKKILLLAFFSLSVLLVGCNETNEVKEDKLKVSEETQDNETKAEEIKNKYENKISETVYSVQTSSDYLQQAFEIVITSPETLLTEDFRSTISSIYEPIEENLTALKNIEVPEENKESHNLLLKGIQSFSDSKGEYLKASTDADPTAIDKGNELVMNASDYITQATEKREEELGK